MSYLVLARKWRPQTFSDLVGQEHVSRTLGNAIQSGRVAHAFLFTGVRGVGKTTSARIMAKALNCEKGPTAAPCLECAPCKEIAAGTDVDVQEIDGASYNGVDEVRRLQESLPYRPARDRSKIFIVDEVHMLSQNAWNAFLKTLEEPPPHVKFIFATTEVHKVPVTILSRCQRYDFKLIPTQLIAKRLRYVLEQEKIEADDAAIALIAREGAGSLRDAMSLLDQAIAWGGDKLVGEEVSRVLGVAARSVIHEIARHLLTGDAAACLAIIGQLSDQGYDVAQVARAILAELRDLVVAKVCKSPSELLDLADEEARGVTELASSADADDLVRLHHGFSRAFDDVVRSAQPRAALEMLLVRLARRPALVPIDNLVARLAELERRLSSGGPPSPQGPSRPAGGGGAGHSGTSNRPLRTAPPGSGAAAETTSTVGAVPPGPFAVPSPRPNPSAPQSASPPSGPPPSASPSARSNAPPFASAPSPAPFAGMSTTGAVAAAHASAARQPAAQALHQPIAAPTSYAPSQPKPVLQAAPAFLPPPKLAAPPSIAGPATPPAPAAFSPVAPPVGPRIELPPRNSPIFEAWRAILEGVRAERRPLAAVLEHASPIAVNAERVVLGYEPNSFLAAQATEAAAVEVLTRHVRAYFGTTTPVAFDLTAGPKANPSLAAIDIEERRIRLEQAKQAVADHPLVRAAVDILGAELRDIRVGE